MNKVEFHGIYYNLNECEKTAQVTENPNKYSGAVSIPETVSYNGVTYTVTSIGNEAFCDYECLESVDLPDSVTIIGDDAFCDYECLESITIPNSVKSIGYGAFAGCKGLESVNIPDSVTSIGDDAFYGCDELTSIYIPDSVTSIGGYAFHETPWYNNLPDGMVYIGSVNYKYKGKMPMGTQITIKDGIVGIGHGAFAGCKGLESVNIPDSVTSIGDFAFFDCKGLTFINIPDSVTSIGDRAFYRCTGLTSVNIPDSVTSIGGFAFDGCDELTDVYCYAENMPSTERIVFNNSDIRKATLHVPAASIEQYKTTEPWSNFGTIVAIDDTETQAS